jgi:hypothetical protein
MVASVSLAFAQGEPPHKLIHFTINAPYQLKVGNTVLPSGKYILYQIMESDSNLFALHPMDLTHEPIAMVRTTRIEYPGRIGYDGKFTVFFDNEETSHHYHPTMSSDHPIMTGWAVTGLDGWEIVSVVEKKGAFQRWTAMARRK